MELIFGENVFTGYKIAEFLGKLKELEFNYRSPDGRGFNAKLTCHSLDEDNLEYLETQGIRSHPRLDHILTLADENPQMPPPPGWMNSDYWNFDKDFDLVAELRVYAYIKGNGVLLNPSVSPTHGSGCCDFLPNYRMFKALVEFHYDLERLPGVISRLLEAEGRLTIPWSELGLEGLRSFEDTFKDFAQNNARVNDLARSAGVFSPTPGKPDYPEPIYAIPEAQEILKNRWGKQLECYRDSLRLV